MQITPSDATTPPTMTVHATRFTPEVLLSAPRRSSGVPNSTGKLVLYTVRSGFCIWSRAEPGSHGRCLTRTRASSGS